MDENENWLITVLYGDELLRCALQVKRNDLPGDCAENPMEPENRKAIRELLPMHVQFCGPIVNVEPLFDVHIVGLQKELAELGDEYEKYQEMIDREVGTI